jgi:hypothetical protein
MRWIILCFILACTAFLPDAFADNETEKAGAPKLPVKEITVFKDGHALILHEGLAVPVNGWVATNEVPEPVLGTLTAFTSTEGAQLEMVKAGFKDVEKLEPCTSLSELLRANAGKDVMLTVALGEGRTRQISGVLQEIPEKEVLQKKETRPQGSGGYYDRYLGRYVYPDPQITEEKALLRADYVGIQTDRSTNYVLIKDIVGVEVTGVTGDLVREKKRVRELALKVSGATGNVKVGYTYLQKGIRWIPSYRVVRSGNGKVKISLSATVVNDMVDLEEVKCHLVVGVPNFLMKDQLSPLALKKFMGRLSSYFYSGQGRGQGSNYGLLMNSMMSQSVAFGPPSGGESRPPAPGAEATSGQVEDLFLYHRDGLTLKKGERATFKIFEIEASCEDIYTWDLPALPPTEMMRHFPSDRQRQLSATLNKTRVIHKIRIKNDSKFPFTTGPALIFDGDKVLGQDMITYTSSGNSIDLPITAAVDVNAKKTEKEIERLPNVRIRGYDFTKVVVEGTLTVKNYKKKSVKLFTKRTLFGKAQFEQGKVTFIHFMDEQEEPSGNYYGGSYYPWGWWRWSGWPYWYWYANKISRIEWETTLEPGEEQKFIYKYEYYYR